MREQRGLYVQKLSYKAAGTSCCFLWTLFIHYGLWMFFKSSLSSLHFTCYCDLHWLTSAAVQMDWDSSGNNVFLFFSKAKLRQRWLMSYSVRKCSKRLDNLTLDNNCELLVCLEILSMVNYKDHEAAVCIELDPCLCKDVHPIAWLIMFCTCLCDTVNHKISPWFFSQSDLTLMM